MNQTKFNNKTVSAKHNYILFIT